MTPSVLHWRYYLINAWRQICWHRTISIIRLQLPRSNCKLCRAIPSSMQSTVSSVNTASSRHLVWFAVFGVLDVWWVRAREQMNEFGVRAPCYLFVDAIQRRLRTCGCFCLVIVNTMVVFVQSWHCVEMVVGWRFGFVAVKNYFWFYIFARSSILNEIVALENIFSNCFQIFMYLIY